MSEETTPLQNSVKSLPNRSTRRIGNRAALVAMTLVMVGAIGAGVAGLHWRADAVAPMARLPSLAVSVSPINIQPDYETLHSYVGRVEPARTTQIAFERAGLVTEVAVDEGDAVESDQILARLDVEPLHAERRRLVAERARISAQLAFSRQTLERRGPLAGRAVSRELFDEVRFEVDALEAQIEGIDARIASLDIDIGKSTLLAPFAGTIAARSIDHGAVVSAGTEVVRLLETNHMQARIGLPPEVAATLEVGKTYRLTTQGRNLIGTLVTTRPDVETGTRTVVALFDIGDARTVAAGELIELFVARRIAGTGAWMPMTALKEGEKGLWSIFVVVDSNDGPVVAREMVEVIHVADQRAYVRGTFAADARIVTGGPNRITLGQSVAVAEN